MAETVERQEIRAFVGEHFRPDAMGLLAKQIRVWQRGCYAGWVMFVLSVGVIVVLAMRPSLVPYPIIYDPDWRIIWHGTAATTREELAVNVRLVEWVEFCRAASSDETRFVEDRKRCAAMVYGNAAKKFSTYNKETTAAYKDRQRRLLVQVHQKKDFVRQGKDQVQITWDETWTPEFGYGSETHRFQVTLTYAWYARPSTWTFAQAQMNPSRVYVTDYWWDTVRTEKP